MDKTRGTTVALSLTGITHTYLLFHCFPYMGYMSVALLKTSAEELDVTVDSVGWYAGLLGTAFTAGRCLGFIPWKQLRHYDPENTALRSVIGGEKKALLWSLGLSAICSVWFGTSITFHRAILARFCLGLSNTLSGCAKRIAIDREKAADLKALSQGAHPPSANENNGNGNGNESAEALKQRREEIAPSKILSVMWWGTVLGPCLGGALSNPGTFSRDTILMPDKELEQDYPFLLPNIVGAILCLVSMIFVAVYVCEESIHENKMAGADSSWDVNTPAAAGEKSPLIAATTTTTTVKNTTKLPSLRARWEQVKMVWEIPTTRLHFIAYWAFSFVVVCIDEAMPLFLIARLSGPGLSPNQIGWILSTAALLVALYQQFKKKHEEQRLYSRLRIASIMGNVPSVLIPLALTINGGTYYYLKSKAASARLDGEVDRDFDDLLLLGEPGKLRWTTFIFLVSVTGCLKVFTSFYFALIGVVTSRTVPPSDKDAVARIMTLGALCARAIAPVFAGLLVSYFMTESWVPNAGFEAVVLWTIIGLGLGSVAAAITFQLEAPSECLDVHHLKNKRQKRYLEKRQNSHVFEKLWEAHQDGNAAPAKKSHRKRPTWMDFVLRPGIDIDTVPFFIIGTYKNDKLCSPHVLTPPLMNALHKHLPTSCSHNNFWLKYSLIRDGASILALEPRIAVSKNTIVAIETLKGDVFGCFMSNPWRKTNKYEMGGESFLWRMKHRRVALPDNAIQDEEALNEVARKEGEIEIFRWTGENDDCQLFSNMRIAAGSGMVPGAHGDHDGFGFIVEDYLSKGSSSPCATYNNPSLVSSKDGRFEVANMEVWSMTPFLFTTEAEKSEDTSRFLQGNMTNARGDAPSSAQSAWTTFL